MALEYLTKLSFTISSYADYFKEIVKSVGPTYASNTPDYGYAQTIYLTAGAIAIAIGFIIYLRSRSSNK